MSAGSPCDDLLGSREARPAGSRPADRLYPGEVRPRPGWTLGCARLPVTGYAADGWMRPSWPPARRRPASGRSIHLLTLDRDNPPAKESRGDRLKKVIRTASGTGLKEWMALLLRDRKSLQLDASNICMVLHALWKKPDCRLPLLQDPEFRQKTFNAFIMDVLKAYQLSEKSSEGDKLDSSKAGRKKRKLDIKDEPVASARVSDSADVLSNPAPAANGTDDGPDDADDGLDDADGGPFDAGDGLDDVNDPEWRDTSPDRTKRTGTKKCIARKPRTPKSTTPKSSARKLSTSKPSIRKPGIPKVSTQKINTTRITISKSGTPKPSAPKLSTKRSGTPRTSLSKTGTPKRSLSKPGAPNLNTSISSPLRSSTPQPATTEPNSPSPSSGTSQPSAPSSAQPSAAKLLQRALSRHQWKLTRRPVQSGPEEGGAPGENEGGSARRRGGRRSTMIPRPPAAATSDDLCARVEGMMMRISGRKAWRDETVMTLAYGDEDDSGVPDSSFLFIRCTRCPELVLRDYAAIRRHFETKCHFLSCVMCDVIFNSSRLALAHLRVTHKDPVPEGWYRLVRCHPCSRAGFFSTEEVIGHMAGHRADRARNPAVFPPFLTCYKRIQCNQCGVKLINHRTELEDHYKRDPPPLCTHDAGRPPSLPCPVCRRLWAGPAALAAHLRLSEGRCRETVTQEASTRGRRDMDSAFCPVCSRSMNPGEALADHLMTHLAPGLRCIQCGLVAGSHQEMRAHRTFTWRCDCSACDTHVGRGSRLLKHVIEDHDGGRRLTGTARARPMRGKEDSGVCPVCGRFVNRLNDHTKASHTTRFCPCCNKTVKLITYRKHQARLRNMDKLRCKVCAKELSSGWALRTHMRLHTGEKPFECELCDAAYAQKVVLKTHMKMVHGIVWPFGKSELTSPPVAITETEVSTAEVLFY
ncbi:zinc finger and BTB domain-containing protein 17-like [Amphibalanus amphitrite]|uniref:zinc finger and BTB domain-containing protein 17-like n=1 Tax=Amphibalanus amphitrite TaxID=1232801 RepID=UPI001C91133F|nr:zinc finger and BTB domain-containing protein 17-like [Amphibalanus amphitrite]XP_043220179.1 zinc finger and BTB domain-containing protein 17-like [Amphibalanus amphitrite]